MSNPDLRRYEKELRASVKGFRLRRRLHRSFRQAVIPFLEETAAPAMRNSPPPSAPRPDGPGSVANDGQPSPAPFAGGKRWESSWSPVRWSLPLGLGSFLGGIRRKLSFSFLMTRLLQKKSFKKAMPLR